RSQSAVRLDCVLSEKTVRPSIELIQINAKEISLLAAFFDTNPEFWFNVQDNHERWVLRNKKSNV
ncbi:TPA: hypothetical protein ACVH5P_003887, partial [Yersinia enterocolitica]